MLTKYQVAALRPCPEESGTPSAGFKTLKPRLTSQQHTTLATMPQEATGTTKLIVTSLGVAESVANVARASLDEEIEQLRAGGKLEAGEITHVILTFTDEAKAAAREFMNV